MTTIITRLYGSLAEAEEAAAALRARRIPAGAITTVTASNPAAAAEALHRAGLSEKAAQAHAPRVAEGGTALVVRAPFGFAKLALRIVGVAEAHDPHADKIVRDADSDPATPFSNAFGWRVLSHEPTPLSEAIGLRVLSRRQTPNITLSKDPAPLSDLFSIDVLSHDPAPLSHKLRVKVLSHDPAPLSRMIGLAPLSAKQTPNVKLSHNPAPLSSLFNLPVLLRDPAPLSRLFGWRTLSD